MFRLRETMNNARARCGPPFRPPNSSGEHEVIFAEFIDDAMALWTKLLNVSFDCKQLWI
jgi:hypothetical protein